MSNCIEIITGGSGSQWTRDTLLCASLKKIREAVNDLLLAYRIPLRLERGLEAEKDPITRERDPKMIIVGIAGAFTIHYRDSNRLEIEDFDYDTWLVKEFKNIDI